MTASFVLVEFNALETQVFAIYQSYSANIKRINCSLAAQFGLHGFRLLRNLKYACIFSLKYGNLPFEFQSNQFSICDVTNILTFIEYIFHALKYKMVVSVL